MCMAASLTSFSSPAVLLRPSIMMGWECTLWVPKRPSRGPFACSRQGRTLGRLSSRKSFSASVSWLSETALICSRASAAVLKGLKAVSLAILPKRAMSLKEREREGGRRSEQRAAGASDAPHRLHA